MNYPQVERASVDEFAKRWDSKGLKFILDNTSRQFALDFANVALRSYVDDLVAKAIAKKQTLLQNPPKEGDSLQKPTNAVATQTVPEPPKEPSRIVLA